MKKPLGDRQHALPRGLMLCVFLSGAAGLIYQVAWSKALGLVFGHAVYAIATVLAAFMAGLAVGSAYLGRWSERRPQPGLVRLYSQMELLCAVSGGLSLAALIAVRALFIAAYPLVGGWQPLLVLLRFAGASVVLFVPTFLMGGTLPILVSAVTRSSEELGKRVSGLYWMNTLGAVVGTLACGLVLLPALGLRESVLGAVALNLVAGALAWRIGGPGVEPAAARSGGRTSPPAVGAGGAHVTVDAGAGDFRFLLVAFGVVGATAFVYEIAWTRLLAISIGSSTYGFTIMLATFLAGTAIGSAAFGRFSAPIAAGRTGPEITVSTFSRTQSLTGLAATSSLVLFHWIPRIVPGVLRATHDTFPGLILAQFATSAFTVLPIAIVFGYNFPAVVVVLGGTRAPGDSYATLVGKGYAANTAGAIVGSIAAGFWLVPRLGSFRAIAATAVINLLLAVALESRAVPRRLALQAANFALICAAIAVGSSSFFYNRALLSLSAVLYGNSYQGHLTLPEIAATNELLFMADGVNSSVAVFQSDNYLSLRVDGKVDASTGDARTQLMLAHLGAAFHPAPRRVLIVGFGSGMTAAAVARYQDVEKIDCVEIEPDVIRASPYFEKLNQGVLADPRMRVFFEDARNFLLTSRDQYDLIISEPSNPWMAGVATLFTTEYYASVRAHLAPGGMFVQWVQGYEIAPDDLRMVIGTLAAHFAEVTLWHGEGSDLLLLGRVDPVPFRFDRLRALWANPAIHKDFQALDVHQPEGLSGYYLLSDAELRQLAAASTLNTDDRTILEYDAPRTLLAHGLSEANQVLIGRFRGGPLPPNLDPGETAAALKAGVGVDLDLNDSLGTQRFLAALDSQPDSAEREMALGRFSMGQNFLKDAHSALQAAVGLAPHSPEALHWLAVADHRMGQEAAADLLLAQILAANPTDAQALTDRLEFAADRNDFQTALYTQLDRMVLMGDPPASEYCRLGAIWEKIPNLAEAEPVLLKGLSKDPYSYACHLELGELYREEKLLAPARQNFEWVVRFFPELDPTIFRSLAGIDLMLGDRRAARAALNEGRRMFPDDGDLQKAAAAE
ncbi:MAG: fused MFS/spermidine synthase [Candidatus Acidiferrales bacterium]